MSVIKKNSSIGYPFKTIKRVIDELKKFPGVGPRLAERIVDYAVDQGSNYIEIFANAFKELSTHIKQCKKCFGYAESNLCTICSSNSRSNNILCIVEYPRNILKIENLNEYKGLYFVLGSVDIENIDNNHRIKVLQERLNEENIKEVIFALGSDYNSAFITKYIVEKIILPKKVMVSQLSIGVPYGYPIEYVDTNTLLWAFKLRKYIN